MLACILQPIAGRDHAPVFEVAFVASDDHDRWRQADIELGGVVPKFLAQALVVLGALLRLFADHIYEIVQRVQTGRVGNVVDEEEGVRFESRRGP